MSELRRADCLALAETLGGSGGVALSGVIPARVVDALDQAYAAGDQGYRATVDMLIDTLASPQGQRFSTLNSSQRYGMLRREVSLQGKPTRRGGLVIDAVCLVGNELTAETTEWRDGGAFARALVEPAA